MIEIKAVASRSALRRFINFPYRFYRDNPHWVPPLRLMEWERFNSRKNPFYEHADVQPLIALRGGEVVGRVAAIDDRLHNDVHAENIATFGCFEAADDEAASGLMQAVDDWAKVKGRSAVRGPLHLSLNESAGLLVDGFDDDPMILMPYNPPVYQSYFERAGYSKVKDLYAWILENQQGFGDREAAVAERVGRRSRISIRSVDMRRMDEELAHMLKIFCRAWQHNWGFVPPTEREAHHTVADLRRVVDHRLVLCADVDGQTIGFLIAIPDLHQAFKGTGGHLFPRGLIRVLRWRRIVDQYRLILLGVLPEYRKTGVYALLAGALRERLRTLRFRRLELSWVLEDNVDTNSVAIAAGARRYKTYRIYQKEL